MWMLIVVMRMTLVQTGARDDDHAAAMPRAIWMLIATLLMMTMNRDGATEADSNGHHFLLNVAPYVHVDGHHVCMRPIFGLRFKNPDLRKDVRGPVFARGWTELI